MPKDYKPKIMPFPGVKKELDIIKKKINVKELPRQEEHPADLIQSHQVFEIPVNKIKPVNRRIFVVGFTPEEKKTRGGVILATSFQEMKNDNKIKRDYRRWFVVDVAEDVSVMVPVADSTPRKLQRGDEVIPFLTEDMTDWSPPFVIDWDNGGMKYYTFEELEIAGVATSVKIESGPMLAK